MKYGGFIRTRVRKYHVKRNGRQLWKSWIARKNTKQCSKSLQNRYTVPVKRRELSFVICQRDCVNSSLGLKYVRVDMVDYFAL